MEESLIRGFMKYTVILLTAIVTLSVGLFRPFYNPDLIQYVAAAYQRSGVTDPQELSEKTFETLKINVRPKQFDELTESSDIRKNAFHDPSYLIKLIPFFSVKIGYVYLIYWSGLLFNCDYIRAAIFISAIFAGLSAYIFGLLLIKNGISAYLLPLGVLLIGYLDLASLATPDSAACFFALTGTYFIDKNKNIATLCSIAQPLFRPDLIVISLMLMAYQYSKGNKFSSILGAVLSMGVYMCVIKFSGNYGWATLIDFAFVSHNINPAESLLDPGHFLSFLRAYAIQYYNIASQGSLLIYILVFYLHLKHKAHKIITGDDYVYLWIPLCYIAVHLLYFPKFEFRYFTFSTTLLFIWFFTTIRSLTAVRRKP